MNKYRKDKGKFTHLRLEIHLIVGKSVDDNGQRDQCDEDETKEHSCLKRLNRSREDELERIRKCQLS